MACIRYSLPLRKSVTPSSFLVHFAFRAVPQNNNQKKKKKKKRRGNNEERAKKQRLYRGVSTANRRRLITRRSRSFEVGPVTGTRVENTRETPNKGKKGGGDGVGWLKVEERKRPPCSKFSNVEGENGGKGGGEGEEEEEEEEDGGKGVCFLCSIKRHDETHPRWGVEAR